MTIDTTYFKNRLEEEKKKLEEELATVGVRNEKNKEDWEPVPDDTTRESDPGDRAEQIEDFEENSAILYQLETRLEHINKALARIEEGTYGICEVSGKAIPKDRLEANPAATTCIEYAK